MAARFVQVLGKLANIPLRPPFIGALHSPALSRPAAEDPFAGRRCAGFSSSCCFHEPLFALVLFPAFYALYLAINHRKSAKKWTLIVASIAFYTWGEPLFVPVVFVSAAIDYAISTRLAEGRESDAPAAPDARHSGQSRHSGFLQIRRLPDRKLQRADGAVRHGASASPHRASDRRFLRRVRKDHLSRRLLSWHHEARANIFRLLPVRLSVPELLAGPILKYHEMETQIADPAAVGWLDCKEGFLRFSRGMGKKLLIADVVGNFANAAFGTNAANLGTGQAWLGLVCFTLQIYFDFSAYSDMAIGLARMLGFRLKENFMMPYASRSLTEFWRRWHMSLTSWIREYLYVPLGGNREGEWRTYLNLLDLLPRRPASGTAPAGISCCGAPITACSSPSTACFSIRLLDRAGSIVSVAATLLIVMIGWVIFRTTSIGELTPISRHWCRWDGRASPRDDAGRAAHRAGRLDLEPVARDPAFSRASAAYEKNIILRRLCGIWTGRAVRDRERAGDHGALQTLHLFPLLTMSVVPPASAAWNRLGLAAAGSCCSCRC